MSIIRANGACEVYYQGVVVEEIRKMNERHRTEMDIKSNELQAARNHRDKLLESRLAIYRADTAKSVSWLSRACESIVMAWCKLYALGEHFGLWEYVGK